jgi:hypothetical protein
MERDLIKNGNYQPTTGATQISDSLSPRQIVLLSQGPDGLCHAQLEARPASTPYSHVSKDFEMQKMPYSLNIHIMPERVLPATVSAIFSLTIMRRGNVDKPGRSLSRDGL